jgi:hypothetical protein
MSNSLPGSNLFPEIKKYNIEQNSTLTRFLSGSAHFGISVIGFFKMIVNFNIELFLKSEGHDSKN